jgi:hypothetical protein
MSYTSVSEDQLGSLARDSKNMIYRVQKGGIYAGRANFKKHDLPRAEGGMYAGRANAKQ